MRNIFAYETEGSQNIAANLRNMSETVILSWARMSAKPPIHRPPCQIAISMMVSFGATARALAAQNPRGYERCMDLHAYVVISLMSKPLAGQTHREEFAGPP
jgi:hypothetical protein